MSSVARSEVVETFTTRPLSPPTPATPRSRRYSMARIVGGLDLVAIASIGLWIAVGPRSAVMLLVVGLVSFVIVRSILGTLPPVSRFKAATGTAVAGAIASSAMVLLAWSLPSVGADEQIVLITFGTVALAAAFEWWIARYKPAVRVLVVGGGSGVAEMAADLVDDPDAHWSLVGILDDGRPAVSAEEGVDESFDGNGQGGWYDDSRLADVVLSSRADLIVLTESSGRDTALDQLLKIPAPSFRIISFDHFCEYAFGRISVRSVSPLWFMSLLHAYGRPYHRVTKRALDLVLAALAFVLAAPLMLILMAAVRLSSPGPVFYRQIRVGEGGAPFQIVKFRTMREDAEGDGNAAWAGENDHRITWIGRFLRRYRLDELPQILNVLRGEMSVVGPRPERPQFVSVLEREIPHWSRRLLVKPGLTGWAQVRMGYTADLASAADKLAYDLFYVKHRGLMLDLAIILRTVRVVAQGSGAR